MLDWIAQSFHLGTHAVAASTKQGKSLLDQGMLAVDHGVGAAVHMGHQTRSTVKQLDSLPAVVSNVVQSIEQPVMNLIHDTDTAARSVTQGTHTGQAVFQILGVGALGWMGWNLFAAMAPRKHYLMSQELQQTAKRIRSNW